MHFNIFLKMFKLFSNPDRKQVKHFYTIIVYQSIAIFKSQGKYFAQKTGRLSKTDNA